MQQRPEVPGLITLLLTLLAAHPAATSADTAFLGGQRAHGEEIAR